MKEFLIPIQIYQRNKDKIYKINVFKILKNKHLEIPNYLIITFLILNQILLLYRKIIYQVNLNWIYYFRELKHLLIK